MFDSERDNDQGSRPFLRRVLVIAAVTVAACAALYPSVTGFAAGPDHQIGCVAIRDGWQRDRTMSDADANAALAALPKSLTRQQMNDPAAVARFREQWRAAQASPGVRRAFAAEDWAAGPGACVRESRHRLIISSVGLGLLLGGLGLSLFVRARKRSDRSACGPEGEAGSFDDAFASAVSSDRGGSRVPAPAGGRAST